MSDSSEERSKGAAARPEPAQPIPAWKKLLLGASCAVMLGALGLHAYSYVSGPAAKAPAGGPPAGGGVKGLLPGVKQPTGPGGTDVAVDRPTSEALREWSPVLFRLGFSFFVGFCIAYALRTFFKISVVAIGLVLLILFGLQYAGIIEVNWTAMQGHYDTFTAWLSGQLESFRSFITGYLPSSATAALGLVTGFKRH